MTSEIDGFGVSCVQLVMGGKDNAMALWSIGWAGVVLALLTGFRIDSLIGYLKLYCT